MFVQHIEELWLHLEKQLNWGLKKVFFRSNCKSSRRLRINEQVIGIEQRIN